MKESINQRVSYFQLILWKILIIDDYCAIIILPNPPVLPVPTHQAGVPLCTFLDVMAHINCHLARLSNHLADRSPGMSVEFLDGVSWSGNTHSSCGQHQSCGPGSQAEWKAENKLSTGSISPCFLTVYAMWPAAPAPTAISALTWWALHSNCETTKQNRNHFNAMRKLTNALGICIEREILGIAVTLEVWVRWMWHTHLW